MKDNAGIKATSYYNRVCSISGEGSFITPFSLSFAIPVPQKTLMDSDTTLFTGSSSPAQKLLREIAREKEAMESFRNRIRDSLLL